MMLLAFRKLGEAGDDPDILVLSALSDQASVWFAVTWANLSAA